MAESIAFYTLAAFILGFAIMVVTTKDTVHSVLFLVLDFLFVAARLRCDGQAKHGRGKRERFQMHAIQRMIVVWAREIPRSAIISARSRKLSLNRRYPGRRG